MQRSGAATRRFYAAFYHWTLRSANPTRRCAGTTSTLVARRKQSTTHGVSAHPQSHSEAVWTSEQLRKEAVQSTADRPTESLDLWEHAVREKSEKNVTVELLVPQRAVRSKDVANRARIHEVKLSAPGLRDDAGDDEPCAIILEGDYTDVKAVWKNLYTHGAGQSSDKSTAVKQAAHGDVEPIAHRLRQDFAREQQQNLVEKECSLPESFWQPIGKEGTIEYLSTQFGLHVDILDQSGPLQYARLKGSERQIRELDLFLDNIRAWELERTHVKNSIGKKAKKQVNVIRRNDLPSESLEVWQSVTREQLQGKTEIDICLPEGVWQQIIRSGGAENLHARFATEFEPLEVSRDGKTRCVSLKGDVAHVERAKSYLEGFQVNVPELQKDKEYILIHSAATGLHTINDTKQRKSARRGQEKTGSNKRTAQEPSKKPHKSLETSSPEKQVLVDLFARFALPEHIRQELEASNESTLAQIQQDSGLRAILRLETAESKQYLKFGGRKALREKARSLLQKSIDDDNARTGRSNPGVEELARSINVALSLARATHVAWIQMPGGIYFDESKRKRVKYDTETHIMMRQNASGKQFVKVVGHTASVKLAMAQTQLLIDDERKAAGKSAAKFEVLKMGLIEDVGEDCPVELLEKSAEAKQQTSSESTVKAAKSAEQPPASNVKEPDTPNNEQPNAQFVWLKVSSTMEHPEIIDKRKAISDQHGCFVSPYQSVTDEEGLVKVFGPKEAVSNAIDDLQQVCDEGRKNEGKPPLKVEVVYTGSQDKRPAFAAVKRSLLTAVVGKDQASESTEHAVRDHVAWLKVIQEESNVVSVRKMLADTATEFGCKVSTPVLVGKGKREIQGMARLQGSEETMKSAIQAMQQHLANETRDRSEKPTGTIEIIKMGLKKDMGDFYAFVQSYKQGAPAISARQPTSSPRQTPVDKRAAKEAEKVSSSSASDKIPQPATLPASLTQQTSVEVEAAEQAKIVSSASTSGKAHQHSTVDKATAPEMSEAAEQAAKQSNQQLSDDMRSALRHITQPVALVTSSLPKKHNQTAGEIRGLARGVTVSSFCTVTLRPIPVVSFNLRVPSRSWDAISASGYLRVHLLKATPEGAAVAHAFTLPYEQPHEPFEHLVHSGAYIKVSPRTKNPAKVPQIKMREAIHADFVARLIPEKCIQVGDHMIVVAEVKETSISESASASDEGALAYGMKGYRQLGGEIQAMKLKLADPRPSDLQPAREIKPAENMPSYGVESTNQKLVADHVKPDEEAPNKVEPVQIAVNEAAEPTEQESDHLQPGENASDEKDMADLYARFSADPDEEDFEATPAPASKNIEDLGPSSPMLDGESLRQVLEENEAAYSSSGLPSQTAADNPALAEALNAVAGAYNDAAEPAVSSQPESTSQTPAGQSADPAAPPQPESAPQTEGPSHANPAKSATSEERPANALSAGKRPWGMADSMTQQIRKMSIYHTALPRRHYSTNNSDSDPKPPNHPPLSNQILQTTVADYLCQIPTHRKRYKTLIKLHRSAETFQAQLQQKQASITEEEATALSTKAQVARRKVARELALRNAQDLRAMLDKGRVAAGAAGAAQWLESNLEQGQVVLLDEAKALRRELEDGKLRVAEFEKAKAELTRDYEAIDAQLMRLKDFAEDDVEELDDEEFGQGGAFGEGSGDGKEGGRG